MAEARVGSRNRYSAPRKGSSWVAGTGSRVGTGKGCTQRLPKSPEEGPTDWLKDVGRRVGPQVGASEVALENQR